jgi:Lon protease-like protein
MTDVQFVSLPLFPLNSVLYPGLFLPLHIFEKRYQIMINDCIAAEKPFGIVLIAKGLEVGEAAEPYKIGTVARIVQVEKLEEGQLNILVTGGERFQIWDYAISADNYLVGQVSWLAEDTIDTLLFTGEMDALKHKFHLYLDLLMDLNDAEIDEELDDKLAKDPSQFSYQVASLLNVSPIEKQALLEIGDTKERIEREIDILDRAINLMQQVLESRTDDQTQELPWGGTVNLN